MGAQSGAGPDVPRGAQGGGAARDRRDRRRVRYRRRVLRGGRIRRHRIAVFTLLHRARILLEIIDSVRDAIGPERALGVRICGDELIEGGSTLAEAVEVARMVEATGQVDYINTSIGVATATLFMIEASMSIPPGYALFIASALRQAVRLPVIGVGRIKDPVQAERALADGHCDLVGVVRGRSPTRISSPRPARGLPPRSAPACPATRSA